MKITKKVTLWGNINNRKALFVGAVCAAPAISKVMFSVAIQNPEDNDDPERAMQIAVGRITKGFRGMHKKNRLAKYVICLPVFETKKFLFSKEVLMGMLVQFKRVQERDLAGKLGLKWELQEGDIVRELSIDTSQVVDTVGPTKLDTDDAIDRTGEETVGESSPSEI